MKKYSIFSFFSGLGFLDLGFEMSGFDICFVNEIYKPFLLAYKYAREKMNLATPRFGYFNESVESLINSSYTNNLKNQIYELRMEGKLVGFIGGPPCPDFSIGGKNRGREGLHGKLSESYIDLIELHKPDFFLFENVKGLWQTRAHREFYEYLKSRISKLGYYMTDRLINSIEYGVPQDRERIILFALSKNIFNLTEDKIYYNFPWLKYSKYPGKKAFFYPWPRKDPFIEGSIRNSPEGIPIELTVDYWFKKNDVDNHPNAMHCFKPKAGYSRFLSIAEGDDSRKSFKRLHRWRYSPTACYGNNEVHLHPYQARRINVAEALSIQSLPKEFELPPNMTLSSMFKGIGNGVPYLAAYCLSSSIRDFLESIENNNYEENNCLSYCQGNLFVAY